MWNIKLMSTAKMTERTENSVNVKLMSTAKMKERAENSVERKANAHC